MRLSASVDDPCACNSIQCCLRRRVQYMLCSVNNVTLCRCKCNNCILFDVLPGLLSMLHRVERYVYSMLNITIPSQARSEGVRMVRSNPLSRQQYIHVTAVVLAVSPCLTFLLKYATEFAPKWAISSEKNHKIFWGGDTAAKHDDKLRIFYRAQ